MAKRVISKRSKEDERVMVVARGDLFVDGIWNGINSNNLKKHIDLIYKKHRFMRRGDAEENPNWKQIIPYLFFENGNRIFLMRRKDDHTDRRLANKYSLGVGGHINEEDIKGTKRTLRQNSGRAKGARGSNLVMEWARREFEEEIDYEDRYKTEFVGILNHDANEVGMVHVGLIVRIMGSADNISVKDEHKMGTLVSLDEAGKYYKHMETWSQIVYDFLVAKSKVKSTNNISGVLPDWLIAQYIEQKVIKIEPLERDWRKQIDQVSIDFHLGKNIKLFRSGAYRFIDTKRGLPGDAMEEINLEDGDPFILEPGAFAITSTKEVLKLPSDILGRLEGKSSLARLGILVHSTAARFDPGWNGSPVLELGNLGPKPAILYCGMPICAFTFEKLAAPVRMGYEGSRSDRYSGSRIAVPSKIHKYVKKG